MLNTRQLIHPGVGRNGLTAARKTLRRRVTVASWAVLAAALCMAPNAPAREGETIRIWKIGSPHTGNTPRATVPPALGQEATRRGLQITVEVFPATGFAATFFDAVTRNAAPDLLVFDNFGVMDGITTALGTFEGIGRDPAMRRNLIRVTDAFDELLGPERGWTFLFSSSSNHEAARSLAVRTPACPSGSSAPTVQGELGDIVARAAAAYLEGDSIGLQAYTDPDRLASPASNRETLRVASTRLCGVWGNDRLTFASVNASYEAETAIGHARVLLILRKPVGQWQLLVAARDPVSTSAFLDDVRSIQPLLATEGQMLALPAPAALLSPADGQFPQPGRGQRFGGFKWQGSPAEDIVAEIVEFAYKDDARLFLTRPARPGSRGQISAGSLWTTRSTWNWRVWTVTRTGDLVFSDARTFRH